MKTKRILAIAALAVIALLYILTLVFAMIGDPQSGALFKASIFCTVVIPCLIYGYSLIVKAIGGSRREHPDRDQEKDDPKDE